MEIHGNKIYNGAHGRYTSEVYKGSEQVLRVYPGGPRIGNDGTYTRNDVSYKIMIQKLTAPAKRNEMTSISLSLAKVNWT